MTRVLTRTVCKVFAVCSIVALGMALLFGVALADSTGNAVGASFEVADSYGVMTFKVTQVASDGAAGRVTLTSAAGAGGSGMYKGSELVFSTVSQTVDGVAYEYAVTAVGGSVFKGNTYLKSVVFESDLLTYRAIGDSAFYGCTNLKSVAFPARVAGIGTQAFQGCTALASVTFEEGGELYVESSAVAFAIGSYAFSGCISLTEITIPAITSTARKGDANATYEEYNSTSDFTTVAKYFYSGAMAYWHNSNGPVARGGIGQDAFEGCTALATVIFEAGEENGMFAYWVGSSMSSSSASSSCVFSGCTALKAVVYEAVQAYWGKPTQSSQNGTFYDMWGDVVAEGFSLYYAVDYYASEADAEAADFAGSTRLARVEYADSTPTSLIAAGDAEALSAYVFEGYDAVPDPNAVAASLGYDTSVSWVWKLTDSQSRREGLSDSCQAYLVAAGDLSAARVASSQTTALYAECDYNLSEGIVQDTVFNPYRYLYPTHNYWSYTSSSDKYMVGSEDAVWYVLGSDMLGDFVAQFEVVLADGTVVDPSEYELSFSRYVCEDEEGEGALVETALGYENGPLLMTVTPLEGSTLTETLSEWMFISAHIGTVQELYTESDTDTWSIAVRNSAKNTLNAVSLAGTPFVVGIGTQDAESTLLAAGYAGLVGGGVTVANSTSATYGLSVSTSFYSNGIVKGGTTKFTRGTKAAGEYSAALWTAFEKKRDALGAGESEGYAWGCAVLVNPAYLNECATAASAYAYFSQGAIFYTEEDGSVCDAVAECLEEFDSVVVVGSAGMVPEATVTAFGAVRLCGSMENACSYSLAVAAELMAAGLVSPEAICIADATDVVDAVSMLNYAGYVDGLCLAAASVADAKVLVAWLYELRDSIDGINLYGADGSNFTTDVYSFYEELHSLWTVGFEPAGIAAGDTVELCGAKFTLGADGSLAFVANLWSHGVIAAGSYSVYGAAYSLGSAVAAASVNTNRSAATVSTASKKAQKIKLSKAKVKVKAGKKKTVKVSGAKGKLVAKAANKKAKRALKLSVKGKKVTIKVKKGAARGTYKVKVYAKAKGSYKKSATKTITVKVK